jgi:hypothetical protein
MSLPVRSGPDRRADVTAAIQAETGIDEAMIDRLVRAFYARVREDTLLGPVFAARISDWEPHLRQMCAFWSSVVLMSGVYHGQPMQKHVPLPGTSTVGLLFSRRRLASCARPEPPIASWNAPGELPRASNSGSRSRIESCCERARDFGFLTQEAAQPARVDDWNLANVARTEANANACSP